MTRSQAQLAPRGRAPRRAVRWTNRQRAACAKVSWRRRRCSASAAFCGLRRGLANGRVEGGCPAPPAPAPDPPAGRERQELLVFFPDFVRIDEFKLDVCTSLEEFGRQASAARVHCSEAISLTPIPHLPARDARPTDAEGFDHRRRPQGEDQSVARPGTQCGGQPRVRLP